MSDGRFLAVIETQKVKGYLFASPILRETRGASLLLDRLNRSKTRELLEEAGGTPVYLGGGSGRVLFPSREQADGFARSVVALYREEAWNARISVEVLERSADETFPAWIARGVGESRKNKLARAEAIPTLGGRWLRPCTSCGREPAERILKLNAQEQHQLCRSCFSKREQIRAFYRGVKGDLDRRIPMPPAAELRKAWPDFILTTLAEAMESRFGASSRTLLPKDFEDLGARSRPGNYLALIYADGNRMGETIRAMAERFRTDEEACQAYQAFSSIIDQATREAAVEAVLSEVGTVEMETEDGEPGRLVPAEFVIAGGDDLILIVPAHAALRVTERFITGFQEKSLKLQEAAIQAGELARPFAPEGLTTSAGVVISHASYPASQLVDLAAELMKSAKRKAADPDRNPQGQGTLDFMVVHESGTESVKRRRKEYEGRLLDGRPVRRTERPCTVQESARLRERVLALKDSGVPRGKLKALYAALFRGLVEAQYEAARIRERLVATGSYSRSQVLQALLDELYLFPFRDNPERPREGWSTSLSELVEIYDFIHEPEPAGAGALEASVA